MVRKSILGIAGVALGIAAAVPTFASGLSEEANGAKVVRAVEFRQQEARIIRVQALNNAPVCVDWQIYVNAPAYSTATGNVGAGAFVAHCSDADGDTLTLVNPAGGYTFTLQPYQSYITVPFSVSDGRGGTGNATLTIHR